MRLAGSKVAAFQFFKENNLSEKVFLYWFCHTVESKSMHSKLLNLTTIRWRSIAAAQPERYDSL
jgi:hypothetical protein